MARPAAGFNPPWYNRGQDVLTPPRTMEVPMPPKAGIHEAERRAQVLRAARDCIVALGYERVTVRDVASAAGVSTGTVVHYFGDKDSVLQAALLDEVQSTGLALRAALAGAHSAWARLERLVEASLPT